MKRGAGGILELSCVFTGLWTIHMDMTASALQSPLFLPVQKHSLHSTAAPPKHQATLTTTHVQSCRDTASSLKTRKDSFSLPPQSGSRKEFY